MGYAGGRDVAANLAYNVRQRGTTLPPISHGTSGWGGMLFVFSLDGAVGSTLGMERL